MIEAHKVEAGSRYLYANSIISHADIKMMKDRLFEKIIHQEAHDTFLSWQPNAAEMLVLTLYAYADLALPKAFEVIFELAKPDSFIEIDFEITQVVMNGWVVIDTIEHGHKHVVVLKFQGKIPEFMQKLPYFDKYQDQFDKALGFCSKADFPEIVEAIKIWRETPPQYDDKI